jgi:hypothetical protein
MFSLRRCSDCPLHPGVPFIQIPLTMGDAIKGNFGRGGKKKHKLTHKETLILQCQKCASKRFEKEDLYAGYTIMDEPGGLNGTDYFGYEGFSLHNANRSVGFHYYTSEVEVKMYDVKIHAKTNIFAGDDPNQSHVDNFYMNYPSTDPRLVNIRSIMKGLKMIRCLNKNSMKEEIESLAWI